MRRYCQLAGAEAYCVVTRTACYCYYYYTGATMVQWIRCWIITRWTWGRFLLWCMCIKKGIQLLLRLLPCARYIPLYTWIRSKYRSKGVHNAIRPPHHHYTSYQALRLPRPVQPSITRTSLINCWLQLGKQSYLLPCIQQIKVKIRWWKLVMTVRMLQH